MSTAASIQGLHRVCLETCPLVVSPMGKKCVVCEFLGERTSVYHNHRRLVPPSREIHICNRDGSATARVEPGEWTQLWLVCCVVVSSAVPLELLHISLPPPIIERDFLRVVFAVSSLLLLLSYSLSPLLFLFRSRWVM